MNLEPFGELSYSRKNKEWFGVVDNISPDNKVELSIFVNYDQQDVSDKVNLVRQLASDYYVIIEKLYQFAYMKYKDTKWEKPLNEIKEMYFLTGVDLKSDSKTWWLVLEPNFNVESVYNHCLRFTMVGSEVVWANFDISKTA